MKNYVKPLVLENDEIAEGVYAASGSFAVGGSDCYDVTGYVHQKPEIGRETYKFQINGVHKADHHTDYEQLIITFNQPVTFVFAQGECVEGNGTTTLKIDYHYHNNAEDNIGLGDLEVKCNGTGLAVVKAEFWCRKQDDQH